MKDKRVALVTGANQGIGSSNRKGPCSARLYRAGRVAQSRALQLDVTDKVSIAAAERIRKELGRLDVLVNNAAISNTSRLPGQSVEEYSQLNRPSNVSLTE